MRLNFFMCALGAFTLTVPTLALPNPSTPRAVDSFSSTLKPIKNRDFEQATGVYRRSGDKFSELDPQTQSQLIYGRPGSGYLHPLVGRGADRFVQHKINLFSPT